MTTQVWPVGTIPAAPLRGSYQEKLRSFNGEFTPDVGPPSRWPRSSKGMIEASFRIAVNATQRQALIDFYVATCKSGSLPFTLADPVSGASFTWFWIEEPSINSFAFTDAFNAQIRLRRFS